MKGPKGLTDDFYGFIKSRKRFSFVIDSYLKDSAFTAFLKKRCIVLNKVCERGTGKNGIYIKRGRGWTSGRNLPV